MFIRSGVPVAIMAMAMSGAFGETLPMDVQDQSEWIVSTSYPDDTVSGRAAADFTRLLNYGRLPGIHVSPRFADRTVSAQGFSESAASPFRLLFSADLASSEAILGVSARPFQVSSPEEAFELNCHAKPAYRSAFAHHDLVLLAVVPWPPTGIWSRFPLTRVDDLAKMRVRTYDTSSGHLLEATGAQTVSLPIQKALTEIKAGSIDAVMSSGDGAAGRAYAIQLKNFTAIQYAWPVSFLVASKSFFRGLSAQQRSAIYDAGARTEQLAWNRLAERIRKNYEQMRVEGVAVQEPAPTAITDALHRAASDTSTVPSTLADDEAIQFLADFRGCTACHSSLCKSSAIVGAMR